MSNDVLRNLINDIIKNPDKVNTLTKDEVIEIKKQIDICGAIQTSKKSCANISITNFREEYLWKLITTTIVGYLYRVVDEYDDESPESEFEYLLDSAYGLNISEEQYRKIIDGVRSKRAKTIKTAARKFLDHNFNFNPDRHVSSSYKENVRDPERVTKFEAFRKAMAVSANAASVETELAKDPKEAAVFSQDLLLKTYQGVNAAKKLVNKITNVINDNKVVNNDTNVVDNGGVETLVGLLMKFDVKFGEISDTLKQFAEPLAAKGALSAYTPDPPADVFYHLRRYYTNHYEQLREATHVLYSEKPDIEFAVQFYDAWSGPDSKTQAEEHQRKNESSVIAPIYTIENGGWTLMGPFQENRDRVNFYNKDTEVIKRLFEQMEQDHKLGRSLMEKRVRKEKAKNIIEEGPDDPGLKGYKSALGTIEQLGAKKVLTDEEKKELATASRFKEMTEVPKDAIQVDVFGSNSDGDFQRTKFYTESEAPKFMQEQIEARKRELLANGCSTTSRVVTDRYGNTKTIGELGMQPKSD